MNFVLKVGHPKIKSFRKLSMKFLAIGDSCLDRFVYGRCDRICPEAPVPVFVPVEETVNGGMTKNVQANVRALGVDCDIITNLSTITKTRYVDIKTNQMLLRVDQNDYTKERFVFSNVSWDRYDAILISSYGKGFINELDVHGICKRHDNVFWDSNKIRINLDLPSNLKILKINQYELELNHNLKFYLSPSRTLTDLENDRFKKIVITYGSQGCGHLGKMYAPPHRVVIQDLSGAGDTFLAALSVSITKGDSIEKALGFANECAAKVVSQKGVTTV